MSSRDFDEVLRPFERILPCLRKTRVPR